MVSFLLFVAALVLIVKGADLAMRYSAMVASDLQISKHLVGFLVIAIISVLPETFVSIMATFQNESSLALGTLFGSNVADLTIIFALVIFFAKRDIKIKSKIVKSNYFYLLTMSVPLLMGLDGFYSRTEGILLIGIGVLFYSWLLKKDREIYQVVKYTFSFKNFAFLLLSMGLLLLGSYLAVKYGIELAHVLNLSPMIIGMLAISLGTTLPELFFSIKAVQKNQNELALGDILGTVITDAVIVVGIVALINPFAFPMRMIYITGLFMILATVVLFYFMKTDRRLTRREGLLLMGLYLLFVFTELQMI